MKIKKIIKKLIFNLSSGLSDMLFLRPYRDTEKKKRMTSENELLHLDLVITESCSRKCRDCSNLMQYYHSPEHFSSEDVIRDLGKILEVFRVCELKIIGGEPFVNQNTLTDVLEYLSGQLSDRVDTVNVITNGTVIPSEKCLNTIKNNSKIIITFSNYGKTSGAQDEFIRLCDENGISYSVIDESFYWLDFGFPKKYEESQEYLDRQYKNCHNRKFCNTLYRGGYYSCPRQAHGMHLGLIPAQKDEYVNLYDQTYKNKNELRRAILSIVRRKQPISACNYCIVGKYIHVPRAIQK